MSRRTKHLPQPESVRDFKARLAAMLLDPNRPIGGAAHAHPSLVRKPGSYGYRKTQTQPTKRKDTK